MEKGEAGVAPRPRRNAPVPTLPAVPLKSKKRAKDAYQTINSLRKAYEKRGTWNNKKPDSPPERTTSQQYALLYI